MVSFARSRSPSTSVPAKVWEKGLLWRWIGFPTGSILFSVLFGLVGALCIKIQGHGVDAVPQAGGRGAVVEDMTEVASATGT